MKASFLFTNKFSYIIFFLLAFRHVEAIDLEDRAQSFVLEVKKIEIPEHPYAFNSSIVYWRGSLLLSFRDLPPSEDSFSCSIQSSSHSRIGLVFLNDDFSIDGEAQLLELPTSFFFQGEVQCRAEDARLINIDERLFIVYSDNPHENVNEGGFRMYIGELNYDGQSFYLLSLESLAHFPGESPYRREKNWVPFDYHGNLLLAYSIQPHRILRPYLDGSGVCEMWASSSSDTSWNWGELRGGTPALRVGHEYLAFFHSSIETATDHSNGEIVLHYFIGAYTFQKDPPFTLTRISPEPIIGRNFYHGKIYQYYWKPVRVVFPCGFVFNDKYIWMAYGRQDHEIWIAKIDRVELLSSLTPVDSSQ